jgi:hypothetical protein
LRPASHLRSASLACLTRIASPARHRLAYLRFTCLALLLLAGSAAGRAAVYTELLPWIPAAHGGAKQSTELVILNQGSGTITALMSFRRRGTPEDNPPRPSTLAPGKTLHVDDVLQLLGLHGGPAGAVVITLESDVPPVIAAFDNTFNAHGKPATHTLMAVSADRAQSGDTQVLVGLRDDATYRTSLFLFDPSAKPASYEVDFLGLDGTTLGTLRAVQVDAGQGVQLDAASFPLPAGAKTGTFTVRIDVVSGDLMSSAQITNQVTGEATYVQGATR